MDTKELSCIDCGTKACRGTGGSFPDFCLTANLNPDLLQESLNVLSGAYNNLAVASAVNESDSYRSRCRIEEIMHLAQLMGMRKLGIATCTGLLNESRQLARIFRAHGYEVYGVACKCGSINKTTIGAPEKCLAVGPNLCNPVLQALILNQHETELNVVVGLCVGHDSLFYKYSYAYVTTLISKDRLLCHNPVAPLYQLDGYWNRLLKEDPYTDMECF